MNLTDYITAVRSEKAEKMMLTSDRSINEISFNCGFSDPKYIYKGFRKWYEKTPSEHKKEYEKHKQEGNQILEYSITGFIEKFGRALAFSNIDEANASFIRAAAANESWRKRYEAHVVRYSGSKLKKEMIRETWHDAGIREIFIPLFDETVIHGSGQSEDIDEAFIDDVLTKTGELGLRLCIEIPFPKRSADEWHRIISQFADAMERKGKAEAVRRCRFVIYFDEFGHTAEAKELSEHIAEIVSDRNVKMALKFI